MLANGCRGVPQSTGQALGLAGIAQEPDQLRGSCADLRLRICEERDEARNGAAGDEARAISAPDSPVAVLVVPTDEELEMARQARELLEAAGGP